MASIEELAAATPATRDRVVDFLRAVSILAVVFGHWFIGVVHWQDGVIRTTSAIGVTPGLWLLTWVFQVMPLFFFVGGYANATAYASSKAAVSEVEKAIAALRSRRVVHELRSPARGTVAPPVARVPRRLDGGPGGDAPTGCRLLHRADALG